MQETDHILCPNCGASVPREFSFCGRCGQRLSDRLRAGFGERRQISVMFCDLVGSVHLSRELDPEDFAHLVHRYQRACVEVIEAHGGYVAQYLGDGILAYFGYPIAGEHSAEEAVRAGLETLGRIEGLANELARDDGRTLSIRIGIHTGLVIVEEMGSGAHRERLAMGETPNLAARLQAAAPPDTLVVSRDTFRLIEGTFRCVDLGPQALKGIDPVQHVYQVVEERLGGGLVDRWVPAESIKTVGRTDQIERLADEWSAASEGRGRVVLLLGEPGIGKSHLAQALRAQIGAESHYCVACRCAPNLESSPFHPIVDWLGRVLNFYPDQPVAERIDMVRFVARRNGLEEPDTVPLLTALLTKTALSEVVELGYSGARARERTEAILNDLVLAMASDRPLLFIVEDVQWIDPSTRNFLTSFSDGLAERQVMLLLTARIRPSLTWPAAVPFVEMDLERLSPTQIEKVILDAAGGRQLPAEIVQRIQEKADGVPLYAQEFTKMVVESGVLQEDGDRYRLRADLPDLAIPSTLQDSLMARLDRLMPVKEVAQICSVFGRRFSLELIKAASGLAASTLEEALGRLIDANLLVVEGVPPNEQYFFRHTLLQEAAYESMLKSRRAVYHRRIARHLIERSEAEAAQPEIIAHHLTRAGEVEQAAGFWWRAGEEAQHRWANEEAVDYFSRGLGLLESLPMTPDLRRVSFLLNVGFASASLQVKGYTHADVARAFEKAAGLASDLKDASASIPAVLGLWSHYTVLADHSRAEVLAERLAKLAQLEPPSLNTFSALGARAFTWFWQGDIGSSRKLIESLLVEFGDQRDVPPTELAFQHPIVGSLSYLSLILWCQGYTDRAVQLGREAIRLAEQIGHPFSLAFAAGFNSVLHVYVGDEERVREMAGRTRDVSEQYGFPFWQLVGSVIGAWAQADEDPESAIKNMRMGLQKLRDVGVKIWTAFPTVLMAEIMGSLGRPELALEACEEILAECELHGEYYFMPEMRRVRARLLDAVGAGEEAVREREYALRLAERQTAKALALRILNDAVRYDAPPSPAMMAMLRTTADSISSARASKDLTTAREILSTATESPLSTTGQA